MSDVIEPPTAEPEAGGLPPTPDPHPTLDRLRPLVGTWELRTCDLAGGEESVSRVHREMMPGGYYLVERIESDTVDISTGRQYVGYDPAGDHLRSMFFSADGPGPFGGYALEYVWELDNDTVTIWMGAVGSPARYTGTFNADQTVLTGRWEWPGGGYTAVETRV